MARTILITGANGFVGSHIVDAVLRQGDRVRAMVRATSDLRWLEGKPVEQVLGSLQDPVSLREVVKDVDAVIHNAGVVSVENHYHYYLHNTEGTRNLIEALLEVNPGIRRFLFVSSQAAGGPTSGDTPRVESDQPLPITDYGKSKLLAENLLRRYIDRLPITIIRPPSVYGPRDRAFLVMFKLIERGLQPEFGRGRLVSLIHVQDLARQIVLQLEHEKAIGETFHAAPFPPVTFNEFGQAIAKVVGSQPRRIILPDAFLRYGYPLVYPLVKLFTRRPPFKVDKLPDLLQSRWTISGAKAEEMLGFEGKLPLLAGVGQTAEWYRWRKWMTTRRDRLKNSGRAHVSERPLHGSPRRYDPSCDLCGLAFEGELKTVKHYEDDQFIIVDCLICRVPMAVLKEHRASFSEEEKARLMTIFHDQFGDRHHPDFEQRRIPEHAHVHYRSTRHAPPWVKREDDA